MRYWIHCVFATASLLWLSFGSTIRADETATDAVEVTAADAKFVEALNEARVHLQKGRDEEALEVLNGLAKNDANRAAVAIAISRVRQAQGDLKSATGVMLVAVKANPKHAAAWGRLAEVQFLQGQYAAARKSCDAAIKLDGDQMLARLVLADVFVATGKIREADNSYRWFVRYYNRAQPNDADSLLLVARGALQYARWHSASEIFNFIINTLCPDALKDDAHRWQANYISGSLLLEKYNRAQAIPEFQAALKINPRAAEVLVALGDAKLQRFDLEAAAAFADRALAINPHLVAALQLKADVELSNGKTQAAMESLNVALKVNPYDQTTLARVAACYVLDDGIPDDSELNQLLSNLDAIDNVKIEAPSRFAKLVIELAGRNPKPGPFLTVLGTTLEARRKFEIAERLYRQAIDTMPELSEPKTALGMLYMRVGKTKEAEEILDAAFDADKFHVRVSNMRKVVKLLNQYESIMTDHFVIRVDSKADKLLGQYMAEYLEEQYDGLVKLYGYEPPHRTQFEIYHNAKGLSAHQWFSARMIGLPWIQTIGASTGVIVALASPTAAETPFNWARVLKHEFVHVITLQQTKFNIPHWFTEALAVTSEGFPRPAIWNKLLLQRVPRGQFTALDDLSQGFIRPESPLDWQFAYCQSRLYAQYMIEKYGEESISKMLDAYRNNMATRQAIKHVFGVEQDVFEKGYRKFVEELVSKLRGAEPADDKTLAELEKAYLADKTNAQAAARYAHALLKARQRNQAREVALLAIERNEAEPLAAVVMAELELRAQDVTAAAKYLEAAFDKQKPHRRLLQLLASIRLAEKKYGEAAELYELGRAAFPYDVEWVKGLVVVYLKTGENDKLADVLQVLADMDADNLLARKKLAEIRFDQKRFADAIRYAKSALHIDVLDVDTHRVLGRSHAGLKQHPQAIREFEVALELKPDDTDTRFALAQTLAAAGRKADARLRLQQVLKQEPNHADAKRLLESLEP